MGFEQHLNSLKKKITHVLAIGAAPAALGGLAVDATLTHINKEKDTERVITRSIRESTADARAKAERMKASEEKREDFYIAATKEVSILRDAPLLARLIEERGSIFIGGLGARYLGLPARDGIRLESDSKLTIDYAQAAQDLWSQKAALGEAGVQGQETLLPHYLELLSKRSLPTTSLEQHLKESEGVGYGGYSIIDIVVKNLDWNAFPHGGEDVRELMEMMDTRILEALFLTEIMSFGDPETNVAVYDLMLRTGGDVSILMNNVALADRMASIGFTHATKNVVGPGTPSDTIGSQLSERGYRLLHMSLSVEESIGTYEESPNAEVKMGVAHHPYDIASYREHQAIAIMNLIWNLLVVQENESARAVLHHIYTMFKYGQPDERAAARERFAEYAALAHNSPVAAMAGLTRWNGNVYTPLHSGLRGIPEQHGKRILDTLVALEHALHAQQDIRMVENAIQEREVSERTKEILYRQE